ncbi:MAG: radical SAM protein [Actinobacteria bacterium]|nr:radical SAM protein [Actinomycetota bacterium]
MHGVYIHVPFCAKRCDYCAFATFTDRHHLTTSYLAAMKTHIGRAIDSGMPRASSIFVGGGTPSMVPGRELGAVIAMIPVVDGAEITVECNPDNVTVELLEAYREAGVNRISLGVQSTVPHVLASLGRTHDADNVRRAVDAIRRWASRRSTWTSFMEPPASRWTTGQPPFATCWNSTHRTSRLMASRWRRARHSPTTSRVIPTMTIKPTSTNSSTHCSRSMDSKTTRSPIGPSHGTSANTIGCIGCRATTTLSGALRTATWMVDASGTYEPQIDTSRWWRLGSSPNLRLKRSATRCGVSRPSSSSFACAKVCRWGRSPRTMSRISGLIEQRSERFVLTRAGRLMANEVSLRLVAADDLV